MSSSLQKFEFPDEGPYAHLGDDEMLMLMEAAGYSIELEKNRVKLSKVTWVLLAPNNSMYRVPNCDTTARVREAFLMFMHLHANQNYYSLKVNNAPKP